MAALADGGVAGGAARAATHMNGIRDLVRDMFVDAGISEAGVVYEPYLPGFFRARKKWDMAVVYKDSIVAALEFKSQVGSVGKNMNNRFEEALGSATDTLAAQAQFKAYGDIAPWLGYVFVLREDDESEQPNRGSKALFPTDPAFEGLSYNQRYQEMIRRFVSENIYQACWFITTRIDEIDDAAPVRYNEPLAIATGRTFRAAIQSRVDSVKNALG